MPADYFVSYVHADAAAQAEALQAALEARGRTCFRDRTDLLHGRTMPDELAQAIAAARCFVPLVSPGYPDSHWCRLERSWALRQEQVLVLPVLVGTGGVPPSLGHLLHHPWSDAEAVADALVAALEGQGGRDLRQRCRRQLMATLGGIPQYKPEVTVPRTDFEAELEEVLREHRRSTGRPRTVVAVLGPQGVGKTTAVCHYLDRTGNLAVVALARRMDGHGPAGPRRLPPLELPRDLPPSTEEPMVVVLDGLNEGEPEAVAELLRGEALDQVLHGGAVLVLTCWPAHWRRRFRLGFRTFHRIDLRGFDDRELEAALARRGLQAGELGPALRELCRRPALLDHVVRLRDRLGRLDDVSKMDVYVADLMYKAEQRWLKADDFTGFRDHLVDLVRAFRERRPVQLAPGLLGPHWTDLQRKLLVMEDLGFVRIDPHSAVLRVVEPEATLAAMALLLRDEVTRGGDLVERVEILKAQLEHIGDFVEPAHAAMMAVGLALVAEDPDTVEALVVWLTDARNVDVDDLADYGHQVQAPLALVAREQVEPALFDNPDRARSRAESTLVWMLHPGDRPLMQELLASSRPVDLSVLQTALERLPLPDLLEPTLERAIELGELFGPEDGRAITLMLGLSTAYATGLVPCLLERFDGGSQVVLKLIRELGDPAFLEPVLAAAESSDRPAWWLDALPRWPEPEVEARLGRLLAGGDHAVAVEVLDWRIDTGRPGIAEAMAAAGLAGLVERELRRAAFFARRLGEDQAIATWLQQHALEALDSGVEEVVEATRLACLLFGRFELAVQLGEIGEEQLGEWRDLPLTVAQRREALAGLAGAAGTVGLDLHTTAQVEPSEAVEVVGLLNEPRLAREYATGLLLPPDQVSDFLDLDGSEPGFALRLACYLEHPSLVRLALEQLDRGESFGLDCLVAVTDLDLLLQGTDDPVERASLLAWAHQVGRPRGAEVEGLIRGALAEIPPDHRLLAHLSGLAHDGWPELYRLARTEAESSTMLWQLAGQGPFDERLYRLLLEVHGDPTGEVLFRFAPVHPLFEPHIAAHLQRGVAAGVPEDEGDKLLFCLCLEAAARFAVPVPRDFLEHLVHEEDAFDVDIAKAVLRLSVAQAPDLVQAALDRTSWPRSAGFLRYVLVDTMLEAPPGSRGPLLAAICHDEHPTMAFPRSGLDEEAQVWTALAHRPLVDAEWEHAFATVERQWRAVLAVLAVYLPDPEPALVRLSREPLDCVRSAAILARVRLAELAELGALLDHLEAEPDPFLASPLALHLAWRIDQHHDAALRSLLAHPDDRVRRATWWIQEAAIGYRPDTPFWP